MDTRPLWCACRYDPPQFKAVNMSRFVAFSAPIFPTVDRLLHAQTIVGLNFSTNLFVQLGFASYIFQISFSYQP